MNAYMVTDVSSDDVTVVLRPDLGRVCVTVGHGALHLSPDTARQMAEDVLAALDALVEGAA